MARPRRRGCTLGRCFCSWRCCATVRLLWQGIGQRQVELLPVARPVLVRIFGVSVLRAVLCTLRSYCYSRVGWRYRLLRDDQVEVEFLPPVPHEVIATV